VQYATAPAQSFCYRAFNAAPVRPVIAFEQLLAHGWGEPHGSRREDLVVAERSVELDEQTADRGVEEAGAGGGGKVARHGEGARIVAAMRGKKRLRKDATVARRHAVAAVLAAQDKFEGSKSAPRSRHSHRLP
jgi:hypothetical protein